MWLVTTDGFFSIVQHLSDPGVFLVRARRKSHLENLRKRHPGLSKVVSTPDNDYPFRLFTGRESVAAIVADLVARLDYSNFKSEVGKTDRSAAGVYHEVWVALQELEETTRRRVF